MLLYMYGSKGLVQDSRRSIYYGATFFLARGTETKFAGHCRQSFGVSLLHRLHKFRQFEAQISVCQVRFAPKSLPRRFLANVL